MFSFIFALFLGFGGMGALLLSFFTWAASGIGGGPGKVEKRVIALSFLAGIGLICLALWLVGVL